MKKELVKEIFVLFIFICITLSSYTQNTLKTKKDTTHTDSVDKANVFVDDPFDDDPFGNISTIDIENVVKFNPIMALMGDIPFYYERKLTKVITAEVALGLTLYNYALLVWDITVEPNADIMDEKKSPGGSFRLGLRLFPFTYSEALQGWYLSPEFTVRSFNAKVSECDSLNGSSLGNYAVKEHRTLKDFRFLMGYQEVYSSSFVLDFYFGVGVRKHGGEIVNCIRDIDVSPIKYRTIEEPVSRVGPLLLMGLKVGFGF